MQIHFNELYDPGEAVCKSILMNLVKRYANPRMTEGKDGWFSVTVDAVHFAIQADC
jgi:hypothetical protein